MAAEETMTIEEQRTYLKRMQGRYVAADRTGRSVLLTEMEAATGLHWKSVTRLVRVNSSARRQRRGRGVAGEVYGVALRQAVASLGQLARARGERELAWRLVAVVLPRGAETEPGEQSFHHALPLQQLAPALALDEGHRSAVRAWLLMTRNVPRETVREMIGHSQVGRSKNAFVHRRA